MSFLLIHSVSLHCSTTTTTAGIVLHYIYIHLHTLHSKQQASAIPCIGVRVSTVNSVHKPFSPDWPLPRAGTDMGPVGRQPNIVHFTDHTPSIAFRHGRWRKDVVNQCLDWVCSRMRLCVCCSNYLTSTAGKCCHKWTWAKLNFPPPPPPPPSSSSSSSSSCLSVLTYNDPAHECSIVSVLILFL